jgi:hypothetical protein
MTTLRPGLDVGEAPDTQWSSGVCRRLWFLMNRSAPSASETRQRPPARIYPGGRREPYGTTSGHLGLTVKAGNMQKPIATEALVRVADTIESTGAASQLEW